MKYYLFISFIDKKTKSDGSDIDLWLHEPVNETDQELVKTYNGVLQFWINRLRSHKYLEKVALRILITPASSCSSERDLSNWKLLRCPNRNRLDDQLCDNYQSGFDH